MITARARPTRGVLARGGDPPEPPAALARGGDPPEPPAALARGGDPPEPPAVSAVIVSRHPRSVSVILPFPALTTFQYLDGAGDLVPQRTAVVLRDQRLQRLVWQLALAPDVAELEAGIVIARVLVVDQPDLLAVLDEVGREQVVVAWDGALVPDGERAGGGVVFSRQVVVAGRDRDPALGRHGPVPALDLEHVEVTVEPLGAVQLPAGPRDPDQPALVGDVGVGQRPALEDPQDQHAH